MRQHKVIEVMGNANLTPVLRTCNRIHHEMLHVADPVLHKRMFTMEIEPQLYALPLGPSHVCRCFHVDDVIMLWNGIFYACTPEALSSVTTVREDRIVEMVECVGVSMVMFVREYLLEAESMTCCNA